MSGNDEIIGPGGSPLENSIDKTTDTIIIIDHGHSRIHSGDRFGSRSYESVARNGGIKEFLLVTPDTTRWAHLTVVVESSDSPVTAEFRIGTTFSDIGVMANQGNRNMNSSKLPTTILYENPTVIDPGALLFDYYIGSGNKVGGSTPDEEELILAQNAVYLIRVVNNSINDTIVSWGVDWYEQTNQAPIV